jgi:hypothetical protein
MKTTIGTLKKYILNEIVDNKKFETNCRNFLKDINLKIDETRKFSTVSTLLNTESIFAIQGNFLITFDFKLPSAEQQNLVKKYSKSRPKVLKDEPSVLSKGDSIPVLGWLANVYKEPGWNKAATREAVEKTSTWNEAVNLVRNDSNKVKTLFQKSVQDFELKIDNSTIAMFQKPNGVFCSAKNENNEDVELLITVIPK